VTVATESGIPEGGFRPPSAWRTFPSTRWSLIILVVVYLPMALTYTLLTRAFEAVDEQGHVTYVEYVVAHDAIPHIGRVNGQESHQPPLYYLLTAGWQKLLGIPAFTPNVVPAHYADPYIPDRLVLSHDYTPTQHQQAVDLHELRLFSVILGLGTVLLTYAGAKVIRAPESVAFAAGLFVALFPRELVVTTSITNDALVIPLCALALVLFLSAERARRASQIGRRRLYVLAMGLVLGAAATTKFNSLPLAGVLFVLALAPSIRLPRGSAQRFRIDLHIVLDAGIAVLGFLVVSGWWFLRNKHLYGQFLATRASEDYLRFVLLQPVPWTRYLVFSEFPQILWYSTWYDQPNLNLVHWMNYVLAWLGVVCLVVGVVIFLRRRSWVARDLSPLSSLAFLGCVASGLVAVLITIKSTSIGDARTAFIGLSAFALILVVSTSRLLELAHARLRLVGLMVWPAILLALDLYVVARFLIPLGGL
jgi:4-amino-4-deoxy-L-arabinose transferase-like glycosyltransferase